MLKLAAGVIAAGLLLGEALPAPAQPVKPSEQELKAVYLLNFLKFVEWPAQAFPGPKAPIVIGVIGEDPFGPLLEQAAHGELIDNRSVAVARFVRLEDLRSCQLLFISSSERERLAAILSVLNGRPVLTVGETRHFARQGVMINFVRLQDRVRFKLNASAAQQAGLKISAQLMQVSVGESP